MMSNIWKKLSYTGVSDNLLPSESRYVILVNRFGVITGSVALFSLLILWIAFPGRGLNVPRILLAGSSLLLMSVILFNRKGHYNLAKWIISWLPVFMIMTISISDKLLQPELITISDFYSYRFFLFASTIIPLLIFSTRQMKLIIINLLPTFVCLVFFDFIHRLLGIGFHQFGFTDPSYYVLNIMIASAYVMFIGFLINQRKISDKFEEALYDKQEKLKEKNRELSHMNTFINEQNYEMNVQSEKLMENHDALLMAHATIEKQKKQLEEQNLTLEAQVKEKTGDLSMVNEELLIRNNELRQFSHTLSHNLKSPVATFQGLLNLIDVSDLNATNKELLKYLNQSVNKMQEIFSDMNQMLEIRNRLYSSIEEVNLQKVIDNLHNQFYHELRSNDIDFRYDFSGQKTLRTNEKQLTSILFQLISNAIKYRSATRKPEIDIKLVPNGKFHNLIIKDNGLGIDMQKYSNKLFFPYQQFHKQGCGKGLGLYLVKLHTESLGGQVRLQSELDLYTEVEVKLRK